MISFGQYITGFVGLTLILCALGFAAYRLRSALMPGWSGASARLAETVLGLSGLVVVCEATGVLGLFRSGWLIAVSALVALLTWYLTRGRASAETTPLPSPPVARWLVLASSALAAFVVFHWAMPTLQAFEVGVSSQDSVWYHMSFSGRFAVSGEVGPLHFTDILATASWFYPQNSELLHGLGIALFGQDTLSPLLNLVWLAMGLLAAWCIGRPWGIGWLTLLAAAVVFDTPMMLEQSGNAANDMTSIAFLLAAVAFLVNGHAQKRAAGAEERGRFSGVGWQALGMAGLATGLAIGTKITLLAPLLVLTVLLAALTVKGNRLATLGVWVAGVAIPSIFWYLRNLVLGGNPLPQLAGIGPVPLPGPDQGDFYPRRPATVLSYADQPQIWFDWFFPALDDRLGPLWIVLLVAMLGVFVWGALKGSTLLIRALCAVGLVAAVAYVGTPLTASGTVGNPTGFAPNLRYLAPALAIGFVLAPLLFIESRARTKRILAGVLTVFLVVGAISQISFSPEPQRQLSQDELVELAATEQDGYRSFRQDSYVTSKLPGALLLTFLLIGLPLGATALASANPSRRREISAAGFVIGAVTLAGAGWAVAPGFARDRYDPTVLNPFERDAGFRASPAWRAVQGYGRGISGSRIAVVGRGSAFGQYVFYGPEFDNFVQYIGFESDHGTYTPIESCRVFKRVVDAGDYDYLVVTPRQNEPAFSTPAERGWMDADPAAVRVVRADPAAVYRLEGRLNPALCGSEGGGG